MLEENYTVYAHINKTNSKTYIGITSQDVNRRWRNGEGYKTGYKTETYFYNAIKKYGWDNFDHEIIASRLTEIEAKKFEILLISKLETNDRAKGYNLTLGGDGSKGFKYSDEAKLEMSKSRSGEKHCNYGKHHSEETRKRISENQIGVQAGEKHPLFGKNHSEETKAKISKAHKGKTHSQESKNKMSESKKGSNSPSAKKIICITTGEVFDYITQASEKYNINKGHIGGCCMGRNKTCGKLEDGTKLVWKYYEDYLIDNK